MDSKNRDFVTQPHMNIMMKVNWNGEFVEFNNLDVDTKKILLDEKDEAVDLVWWMDENMPFHLAKDSGNTEEQKKWFMHSS